MVSRISRKQHSVSLSTAEAEYFAACMAAREAVWLKKLLAGLFGQRQIEVSRDVTFHKEVAFRKSKELPLDSDSEPTSPKVGSPSSSSQREENEDDLSLEPIETLERSLEEPPTKRRPGWLKETLQEAERIVAPKGTFRERKRPHRYGGYVVLVNNLIDYEPSEFEEANKLQV